MLSYIVIRLIPESPVDGATFATYLDGLRLQVFDAYTGDPLSDFAYSSPLVLTQWPGVNGWLSLVSISTSLSTQYNGIDCGKTLTLTSTDGILKAPTFSVPTKKRLRQVPASRSAR
jgi:hypothetical protein